MECSCGGESVKRAAKVESALIEYQECKACGKNNFNDMKARIMEAGIKANEMPLELGEMPPPPRIGTLESRVLARMLVGQEVSVMSFPDEGMTEDKLANAVENLNTGNYYIEEAQQTH